MLKEVLSEEGARRQEAYASLFKHVRRIRLPIQAYVSQYKHTSAYSSIRQPIQAYKKHTSARFQIGIEQREDF